MFAGCVDPSMYLVLLNASEIGWSPRPPHITHDDAEKIIHELSQSSARVSQEGFLDYRFAASLHERKHFYDIHFSTILWKRFLSWFHCTSNVFSIINNLRGKKNVTLPLYTIFGSLKNNLPLDENEKDYIKKACNPIFATRYDNIFSHIFETSATLLQFAPLLDWYRDKTTCDEKSYEIQYYLNFFEKPISNFGNNIDKTFAFYNFCSWFCATEQETILARQLISESNNVESAIWHLLKKESFYENKLKELLNDSNYLLQHAQYYRKVSSPLIIDMNYVLSKLVSYRIEFFNDIDAIIAISSSIKNFTKWIDEGSMVVPFLVDYGQPLDINQDISDDYKPSRWIIPRDRFFYYQDTIGHPLFELSEIDEWLWVQHLSNFIINPGYANYFNSIFVNKDFLEFEFIDERLYKH